MGEEKFDATTHTYTGLGWAGAESLTGTRNIHTGLPHTRSRYEPSLAIFFESMEGMVFDRVDTLGATAADITKARDGQKGVASSQLTIGRGLRRSLRRERGREWEEWKSDVEEEKDDDNFRGGKNIKYGGLVRTGSVEMDFCNTRYHTINHCIINNGYKACVC